MLTALLFLPIPVTIEEDNPMPQAKAATISLVDRVAVQQPDSSPREQDTKPIEETAQPVPMPQVQPVQEPKSEQQAEYEPPRPLVEEAVAATKVSENLNPVMIDGYYAAESVTTAPVFDRALLASRIAYPPLAKRQRKEGLVVVRLFIAANGLVERIIVEEDPGYGLADAAITAFTSFKASPALYNDEAVAVTLRYPIRFTLQ
jgi:protein TonB